MRQATVFARALFLSFLLVGASSACDSASGTNRGPKPATSFTFDDDDSPGIANVGGELVMRSCGFAVRDEHKDRYFADGQASTSPSPSTIIAYFTQTNLEPPPVGELAVPGAVALRIILPSPYGTMDVTAGKVTVSEADGWRVIALEDVAISNSRDSGVLNATLACGM